jgi:hypothetical protein
MKSAAVPFFTVLLSMSAQAVPALASPTSVTAELARRGTATCEPAQAFFCENIHVGCSGRSTIRTVSFDITIKAKHAWLKQRTDTREPTMAPRSGPIEWANDDAYVIVWLRPRPDYLKISSDGSYSFRHTSGGTATMSNGICH